MARIDPQERQDRSRPGDPRGLSVSLSLPQVGLAQLDRRRRAKELTFAGYTNYFLWLEIPNLRTVLRRKAERGCRVRFLIGDPDSEVTRRREELENVPLTVSTRIHITLDELSKLSGIPGIEARFGDDHIAMSVFTFDGQMLVTPHLARLVGHDSPLLHIQRCQDDGLFDRFAYHVAELWESGRAITLDNPHHQMNRTAASTLLRSALAGDTGRYQRNRSLYVTWLASTVLCQGDLTGAAEVGLEALRLQADVSSSRSVAHLRSLRGKLLEHRNRPLVNGLTPALAPEFTAERDGRTFAIKELAIREQWRRRGVGRRLHDALIAQRAEERATLTCRPDATAAVAAYEAWGWNAIGRVRPVPEGPEYLVMLLSLQ